ncbi:MAG: glycosyltransferase, partial [Lachnospiraceae bacterium]|nr:glycosyltransferase [Lachnospiraceae bacterium]
GSILIKSTKTTLIAELEEKMSKDKYQVLVACKKSNVIKQGVYLIGNRITHLMAGLYSRISGLQGYGCVMQTQKLIMWIKEEQPDIIHLQNLHGNYLNMNILFKYLKKYDGKIVWTLHDCWSFTGNCSHYVRTQCTKWKDGKECGKCPNIKKYPPSWFFDRSHKMFKGKQKWYEGLVEKIRFVTVSEWLKVEAEKSLLLGKGKIETIYNWVDREVFKPENGERVKKIRDKFGKEMLLFSAASDWMLDKGLNDIYELAEHLDESVGIMLAGKCRNRKAYSNVFYLGEKSKNEMADYYNAADIYLNLSLEETFGLTTAEALSCGTPVIVRESSANPEVAGECGIKLKDLSPELVLKAIYEIRKNPEMFSSEKCQSWVDKMFIRNIGCEKYLALYEEIVG